MARRAGDSAWRLRADLVSARVLVWVAQRGRDIELTSEAHWYFFDRYSRLALCRERRGHQAAARRLWMRADEHYRAAGGDGPPYAAAMAMPRPAQFIRTDAVSRTHSYDPDDAA